MPLVVWMLYVAAELTWFDRDWYRVAALDVITSATYMLLALIMMTSIEEILIMVSVDWIIYNFVIMQYFVCFTTICFR